MTRDLVEELSFRMNISVALGGSENWRKNGKSEKNYVKGLLNGGALKL